MSFISDLFGQPPFISWDSEGANDSEDMPQRTILFGAHTPDGHRYITGHSLETGDMLNLIFNVAEDRPKSIHVGYGFGYDANMIVRHLDRVRLEELYGKGYTTFYAGAYSVKWIPSKFVTFTRRKPKLSVTIYDVFSYFHNSFVNAVRDMLGDSPELRAVERDKNRRGGFANIPLEEVVKYWKLETEFLTKLMDKFRQSVFNAGFSDMKHWHGPGTIANLLLERHNVDAYMSRQIPPDVNRAAQYAYAGGRFEGFKIGRHTGKIYGYDRNSAYPYAISQLPCLHCGEWEYVDKPHTISRFGVYQVELRTPNSLFTPVPSPLFYRDRFGNIAYTHCVSGWYWSPEVDSILHHPHAEIMGGWVYSTECDHKPFGWVPDVYRERKQLKRMGNPSELALKLGLNSLYGKMAQRVGWNERKRLPPKWHQLEWAGWVTSYVRRQMYDLIHATPWDSLISVETDGVYSTAPPDFYGITDSGELGEWGVSEYDEGMFFQSGLYSLRKGDTWLSKIRGFDRDSFSIGQQLEYLEWQRHQWESLQGKTTRFIGLGAALASSEDFRKKHCRWEARSKDITPGTADKRWHFAERCRACIGGLTGGEALHDLVVKPPGGESYPHLLPWVDEGDYSWRDGEELCGERLASN